MLKRLFARFLKQGTTPQEPLAVLEWYRVSYDDQNVYLNVNPPEKEPWSASFRWDHITRICFKAEDFTASDGIYVFIQDRTASYPIPTEADGGPAFWGEILRRNLFDHELAIKAASAIEGVFAWPPFDEAGDD